MAGMALVSIILWHRGRVSEKVTSIALALPVEGPVSNRSSMAAVATSAGTCK